MIYKSDIQSMINSYTEDYAFLADEDKKFFNHSNKQENEARESEMALIDGFISALKGLINENN